MTDLNTLRVFQCRDSKKLRVLLGGKFRRIATLEKIRPAVKGIKDGVGPTFPYDTLFCKKYKNVKLPKKRVLHALQHSPYASALTTDILHCSSAQTIFVRHRSLKLVKKHLINLLLNYWHFQLSGKHINKNIQQQHSLGSAVPVHTTSKIVRTSKEGTLKANGQKGVG